MYICEYCGKECKNNNSLFNHQKWCIANPTRLQNPSTGKPAWNSGLTSKDDSRILSGNELKKYILDGIKKAKENGTFVNTGKAATKEKELERKRKISETMKKKGCGGYRPGSGRGKKGHYKGFYCDSTYELVYIIYNLDHKIKFQRCTKYYLYKLNNKICKYYPDFELEDGTLIEIKGYHTELVDLKTQAVKDKEIKVLFEKDLKYAFDWVKQNYSYKQLSDLYETKQVT